MSSNVLRDRIVNWLKDYIVKSEKNGFVLGMSGGVDSSVIALLAREAVEKTDKTLLALLLPIHMNHIDYYDEQIAKEVAEKFSIPYKIIDLTSSYKSCISNLDKAKNSICYTNLKARLRLSVVYFYANNLNLLVLGTVNKGEFYIGYFPKNASAGDIMPIADLLKREIREIGKSYGLPGHIVNRKASGCIWARTAEEEWGFTEEELDFMIETFENYGEEKLLNESKIEPNKCKLFIQKYKESTHKRQFYPIFKKNGK